MLNYIELLMDNMYEFLLDNMYGFLLLMLIINLVCFVLECVIYSKLFVIGMNKNK